MDAPRRPVWGRSLAGLALVTAAVFGAAGRIDYWQGWIFVGLTAASLGLTYFFLRKNPDLVAERARPGRGVKWWDKLYYLLSTPLWFASIIVACLDEGRGHWAPDPPRGLYAAAVALFVLGQGLYLWAKAVNPFFSSVARIQADRGQTVCREGPYRLCRHPGYLGGVLFGLASPVILGSYWALLPQAGAIALLVVRTLLEDRMLTRDLLWYAEYKRSVPSLLVPGLW